MIAFHGDEAIKAKYIARVEAHRAADELVAGATGDGGKGCSVWCTFDDYNHSRGPVELGIPTELFSLNDFIFEGLAKLPDRSLHQSWPGRFLGAALPGADLRLVFDRFQHWILTEEHPDRGEHCARMGALIARRLAGDEPTTEQWDQAARAAGAAWAARAAGAAWAARAAGAAWAARAARAAWAARAARAASIQRMADALIKFMAEAPVPSAAVTP